MSTSDFFHHPLLERALRVAARADDSQFRKGSDVPYLTHPTAVAMILIRAGIADEVVLAAGILHDVLEDTPVTEQQLASEFPSAVVELVQAASERKYDADGALLSWHDRKREHIALIIQSPREARAIVLADKLHNLAAMVFDLEAGAPIWERFRASAIDVLAYYRTMIDACVQNDEFLIPLTRECNGYWERLRSALEESTGRPVPMCRWSISDGARH